MICQRPVRKARGLLWEFMGGMNVICFDGSNTCACDPWLWPGRRWDTDSRRADFHRHVIAHAGHTARKKA